VKDTTRTMRRRRRRTVDLGVNPQALTPATAAYVLPDPATAGTAAHLRCVEDLVLLHWRDFFHRFREDERGQEDTDYRERAFAVQECLDRLPFRQRPHPQLAAAMLELLLRFERSRFEDLSFRIDELATLAEQGAFQVHSAELAKCHLFDEVTQCLKHVEHALDVRRGTSQAERAARTALERLRELTSPDADEPDAKDHAKRSKSARQRTQ
jgi:hypothetical protein